MPAELKPDVVWAVVLAHDLVLVLVRLVQSWLIGKLIRRL